jgi:hypothetical protein
MSISMNDVRKVSISVRQIEITVFLVGDISDLTTELQIYDNQTTKACHVNKSSTNNFGSAKIDLQLLTKVVILTHEGLLDQLRVRSEF